MLSLAPDDRLLAIVAHDDDAILMGSSLLSSRCSKRLFVFSFSDATGGSESECLEAYAGISGLEIMASHDAGASDMDLAVRRAHIEAAIEQIRSFEPTVVLTNQPMDSHHDHVVVSQVVQQAVFHVRTWVHAPAPRALLCGEILEPLPRVDFRAPAAVALKSAVMGSFESQANDFPYLEANLALNRFRGLQVGRLKDIPCEAFMSLGAGPVVEAIR